MLGGVLSTSYSNTQDLRELLQGKSEGDI